MTKLREKYFNERVENELQEFKKEIEKKFSLSDMNTSYMFPRIPEESINLFYPQNIPASSLSPKETSFFVQRGRPSSSINKSDTSSTAGKKQKRSNALTGDPSGNS